MNQKAEGNQGCYLAEISPELFEEIQKIAGFPQKRLSVKEEPGIYLGQKDFWEDKIEKDIKDSDIKETEKESIILSRRGQGRFRSNLLEIEHECRVTHIDNQNYLIASHIKPWRHSSNSERLDGENGFLMSPNIDFLFDRGLISFKNSGEVIVSPVADNSSLSKMTIEKLNSVNVGSFTSKQSQYLEYHRDKILLAV